MQDAFEAIRVEKHDTKLAAPMADPAASATAVLAAASVATAAAFAGRSTVSGLVGKALMEWGYIRCVTLADCRDGDAMRCREKDPM